MSDSLLPEIENFLNGPQVSLTISPASASRPNAHELMAFNCIDPEIFFAESMLLETISPAELILSLDNVVVIGDSFILRDNDLVFDERIHPRYLRSREIWKGYSDLCRSQFNSAKGSMRFDFIYLFSHPHARHYGHFLSECLPRLVTIKRLYEVGLDFPIYVGVEEPTFVKNFISLLIPEATIVPNGSAAVVQVQKALIPAHYQHYIYPERIRIELQNFSKLKLMSSEHSECLFVSRANVNSMTPHRRIVNEHEITLSLEQIGFEIFHPQQHSLEDQIAAFNGAKILVGEYGSGMHNALFSPDGTIVLSINWLNLVQQAIGINFGHKNAFVFTPNKGHGAQQSSDGMMNKEYYIDPDFLSHLSLQLRDRYASV